MKYKRFYHEHLSLQPKAENLMKACLCLYVDKIWFKVVYMLYFSFQKLKIFQKRQKNFKQSKNAIFKQYFNYIYNNILTVSYII